MLVLVLISIVLLFVLCTTPAAVLSILISPNLDQHLGFQTFRAIANNLELLNFALNFYIYCLCSAEIRRAFVSTVFALQLCAAPESAAGVACPGSVAGKCGDTTTATHATNLEHTAAGTDSSGSRHNV